MGRETSPLSPARILTFFCQWPAFAVALLMAFAVIQPAVAQPESTSVIVNQSVSTEPLSRTDLRQIFTGQRQYWSDGSKIQVFVLNNNSDIHKAFCRDKLKMFPYQLERLWNQVTYSGQGEPPVRIATQQQLIDAVLTTPGAIGYTRNGASEEAKAIRVESK